MECQELDQRGIAEKYLNGQLDPRTLDELELHILECPSCQRTLELFQTIRDDLTVHAPEIRVYSPAPRGYLRWTWLVVTSLVVVAGGIGVWQIFHEHAHIPIPRNARPVVSTALVPSPTANPGLPSRSGADSGMKVAAEDRSGIPARLPRARNKSAAGTKTQTTDTIANLRTGTIDNLPTNGRDYINYPKGNPIVHDSAPAQPNSEAGAHGTTETEAQNKAQSLPTPPSPPDFASDQVANLATVRPFPYTFAGVASSRPSGGGSTRVQRQPESALSETPKTSTKPGANGFNTAQDYFREGMSAYVGRDYETAVNLLTQAVMLEPDFSEANLYLGICKLLRGNPSEAASALQIAAKDRKPALAQAAHYFLAKAYLQLRKLPDAEGEFRIAATLPGRLASESNELAQKLDDIRRESGKK